MFMCIELMLNAVNLTLVSAGRALNDISGQVAVFFILVVAAAEVVVGLAIIVAIFRVRATASVDELSELKRIMRVDFAPHVLRDVGNGGVGLFADTRYSLPNANR